ncbi:MAG: tetratricopeptide repeat protein [Spirochaetaceae bacterium]|jgi:hypothetical protein|nr:tetratricopeptide repeat protein [Spirochaetaceae bacterium]
MTGRILAAVTAAFLVVFPAHAQLSEGDERGNQAIASQYVSWAEEHIAQGRFAAALLGLERAGDFADESSDISYLSALCQLRLDQARRPILEALRRALEANRWHRYAPQDAQILEAGILVALRRYEEALAVLLRLPESLDARELTLAALKGLGDSAAFREAAGRALALYPREGGPAALVLDYARSRLPHNGDRELVNLVLRRLPLLVAGYPELAYKAAPFIRDTEEARRLIAAYRADGNPSPLSIPAALNLGLISEAQAVAELFAVPGTGPVPYALIGELWDLLRTGAARSSFSRNLSVFSGVITEDEDNDGFVETRVSFHEGDAVSYHYDADQDGVPDIEVSFAFGVPESASLFILPEVSGSGGLGDTSNTGDIGNTSNSGEGERVRVYWERYPAILRAELGETVFFPPPLEYFYAPLDFVPLAGNGTAPLYPRRDPLVPRISRRSLVSSAVRIERPGSGGAVEYIDMVQGIPRRAREIAGGRLVAETEFRLGQLFFQRLDLDMDGRLETIRRFRRLPGLTDRTDALDFLGDLESSESDWDGDGLFEYGEIYYPDGRIERSWDLDGDGRRERRETQ